MSFYPSSIKASKDLDKTMGVGLIGHKADMIMEEECSDEQRLKEFKEDCRKQLDIGKPFWTAIFGYGGLDLYEKQCNTHFVWATCSNFNKISQIQFKSKQYLIWII